jgi:DNA-binding MarR family transcriptional regulator
MRRLPPLLRRAWFSLNQSFRQRILPLGLTPDQYTILRWLAEAPSNGLTQSEITQRMASDANTITATVRRMEAAGLVKRSPHETDGRAKRVQILPPGKTVFQQAHAQALKLQNGVLSCLTNAESKLFLELLERVADACSGETATKSRSPVVPKEEA